MHFNVYEKIYKIKVKKESNKTYFYGSKLAQLIATKGLSLGDMLIISFNGPEPTIKIAYVGPSVEEESDDAMSEQNESDDATGQENETDDAMSEEDDPWKYVVIGQQVHPTEREKERVLQRLPPRDSYLGKPFVHRITNTNVANGHVMVCDFYFFHIPILARCYKSFVAGM